MIKENEGIIKDVYESAIKEVQTILTIAYFLAVGIGMVFTYQKYSEFGINIFDYADLLTFFTAPFSDFRILIITIIAMGIPYFYLRLDFLWEKKHPKSYAIACFGILLPINRRVKMV